MKRLLLVLAALSVCSACKWVTVRVAEEGEPTRTIKVPFKLVQAAFHFTVDEGLAINDLAGVDAVIDIETLARAMRVDGERVRLDVVQEGAHMTARVLDGVLAIDVLQEDEDQRVRLRLPLTLLDMVAEDEDGMLRPGQWMRAIKKHRGVLVDVRDRGGHVQIILK